VKRQDPTKEASHLLSLTQEEVSILHYSLTIDEINVVDLALSQEVAPWSTGIEPPRGAQMIVPEAIVYSCSPREGLVQAQARAFVRQALAEAEENRDKWKGQSKAAFTRKTVRPIERILARLEEKATSLPPVSKKGRVTHFEEAEKALHEIVSKGVAELKQHMRETERIVALIETGQERSSFSHIRPDERVYRLAAAAEAANSVLTAYRRRVEAGQAPGSVTLYAAYQTTVEQMKGAALQAWQYKGLSSPAEQVEEAEMHVGRLQFIDDAMMSFTLYHAAEMEAIQEAL